VYLKSCGISELLENISHKFSKSGGFDFVFCLELVDNAKTNLSTTLNSYTEKEASFLRKYLDKFLSQISIKK